MSNYGLIIAAGKQSRFGLEIPKALVDFNGNCLLDINYNNLQEYCSKVFVVCSFENSKFFDFEKYNKIVISSGYGSGDAILRALNYLSYNENITDEDSVFIIWGDSLVNKNLYKYILDNSKSFINIPCIYEQNPYVEIRKDGNSLKVLFSKYGDNIEDGFHDQCCFYCRINYLLDNLEKFYNKFFNSNSYSYLHRHGEFEFLDLFNEIRPIAEIINIDDNFKTLSFNTSEELENCILHYKGE